jgi:hypothetical protein
VIELPKKWPGMERLRVILATLRLLGIDIPRFFVSRTDKNGMHWAEPITYDQLTRREKKERWETFRLTVDRKLRARQ